MSGGTDSMVLNLQSGFRDQVKRIDFRESKLEKVRALCFKFRISKFQMVIFCSLPKTDLPPHALALLFPVSR